MLSKTTRAALLGSVTSLIFTSAYAQTAPEVEADADPQACAILAEQLAADAALDAQLRTEVEEVIATGNLTQCQLVYTAWQEEGVITHESLELVATEQVTERMIVQQEVEVAADVAVYQPPAEVDIDSDAPEIVWTMPRQSVTVDEQAPQITVRQGQPMVNVEVPQPRVTVMIPEPEVIITWPESTIDMAELEPMIEVRIPEPRVNVAMPDPVVELTIGGGGPTDLVELEDGRFAPQGATAEDLEPRIRVNQAEAMVSRGTEAEAPEITFNRPEPVVNFEGEAPQVNVEIVGEPDIQVTTGQQPAAPGAVEEPGSVEEPGAVEEPATEAEPAPAPAPVD